MKTIFTTLVMLVIGTSTWAQIEASFSYGYRFGGRMQVRVDNEWGEFRVSDSEAISADLRLAIGDGGSKITMNYTRQATSIDFVPRNVFDREQLFAANIEYYSIGIVRGGTQSLGFNPFGSFSLGVGVLSPRNTELRNEVRLAGVLGGGFNYFFTEKVGLRMSVGILTPFQFGGAGMFCGGGGCSVGVGASSTILQGDISAGVVVRLGE